MSTTATKPYLLLRTQIPRSNVGQVAHVSPRPRVTSQKVDIPRRFAGCGWGAGAITLRTATLALVHSTTEYCALARCLTHTRPIDPAINDALRIVTGCLRPTPAENLPIVAGTQPAERRRDRVTLSLACRAMEPGHLLHCSLVNRMGMHGISNRHTHLCPPHNNSSVQLTTTTEVRRSRVDHRWNAEWLDNTTRRHTFIPDAGTRPPGMALPRRAWVQLNRLRTGVGRSRSCLHEWDVASPAACECGAG